jgi:hypothetical protein
MRDEQDFLARIERAWSAGLEDRNNIFEHDIFNMLISENLSGWQAALKQGDYRGAFLLAVRNLALGSIKQNNLGNTQALLITDSQDIIPLDVSMVLSTI